jgi:hypothetical protein
MTSTLQTPADVTVLPTSACEWRVVWPSGKASDALSLVGFIRDVGGVFETTAIGRPLYRAYFASFQEAIGSLVR